MKKRLIQSSIVVAFLLSIIGGIKYDNTVNDADVINYIYETDFQCGRSGVFREIVPNIVNIGDIAVNEVDTVAEMALEGPNSAQIGVLEDLTVEYMFKDYILSESDIEAIAQMTLAEAENQSELGQRLVIDVILNRLESDVWQDESITEVLTHQGQFESYDNGRYYAVADLVTDDTKRMVIEEINQRTNEKVIYFNTTDYNGYAPPICQEGDHYFCGQQ